MKKALLAAIVLTIGALGPSNAATILNDNTPTGELASPGSVTKTFISGAGPASASFEVRGYRTLDGVNCCTDTFTFSLDGAALFSGAFDLGGGGANTIFLNTNGAKWNALSYGFALGGQLDVFLKLGTLAAGNHKLTFDYSGQFQGFSDEAWGLNSVSVSAGVPEAATWMMMLLGFGGIGFAGYQSSRWSQAATA